MKVQEIKTVQSMVGNKVISTRTVIEDVIEVTEVLDSSIDVQAFLETIASDSQRRRVPYPAKATWITDGGYFWQHGDQCQTIFCFEMESKRYKEGKIAAGIFRGVQGFWFLAKSSSDAKAPYEKQE